LVKKLIKNLYEFLVTGILQHPRLSGAKDGFNHFVIEKGRLLETTRVEEGGDYLYKWIVLATQEEWLTHDDLYDLNFAFVFVAGASAWAVRLQLFDNTLEYQFEVLDDEEEEAEPLKPG
jgi:hypothetical protein